jgi:hypothetical protein
MKHKHAELMAEYAKDAFETDKPWERWEFSEMHRRWSICPDHPCWTPTTQYRRKQEPPKPREFWVSLADQGKPIDVSTNARNISTVIGGSVIRVREIIEE